MRATGGDSYICRKPGWRIADAAPALLVFVGATCVLTGDALEPEPIRFGAAGFAKIAMIYLL
jgi:hypothetical protein